MCELNAVMVEGDSKKTVMEDVIRLTVNEDDISLTGMLGNALTIRGKIVYVDLSKNEALIQKID